MQAIDMYSGIGGWSLGLRLAQLEIVSSYERWGPALTTYENNLRHKPTCVDIRALDLNDLPSNIDIVIGSPPCTQFSYSNRGGSGDIQDGLIDIIKFLEVVDHLKPKFWAMENVPRVAKVIDQALNDSANEKFRSLRHLFKGYGGDAQIKVYNLADFGVPQKRKRSIIGNVNFKLLESYIPQCKAITLGDVISGLYDKPFSRDLIYGIRKRKDLVTDNEIEACLNDEERRMNEDAKRYHPVYNRMSFPETMDQPVRTVTATCTRVSRESIVIAAPEKHSKDAYRRLTIRERGLLQGFPITYQFFGTSYSQKLKMVGNALPPPMAYYIACAMKGTPAKSLVHLSTSDIKVPQTARNAPKTPLEQSGKAYLATRRFRAAIRTLRFGSGLRFELSNSVEGPDKIPCWAVEFYYGPSKDYRSVVLDKSLLQRLAKKLKFVASQLDHIRKSIALPGSEIPHLSAIELQDIWTKRQRHHIGPYQIVDWLDALACEVIKRIEKKCSDIDRQKIWEAILSELELEPTGNAKTKIQTVAIPILVGFMVGSVANTQFAFTKRSKDSVDHTNDDKANALASALPPAAKTDNRERAASSQSKN